jgi:hypothetical protein
MVEVVIRTIASDPFRLEFLARRILIVGGVAGGGRVPRQP